MEERKSTDGRSSYPTDYNFLSAIAEGNDLDLWSYTLKIKDELWKLENESITDYLSVNQDVAFLYQHLDESN